MPRLDDSVIPGFGLSVQAAECLYRVQSPWQTVELWQTEALGRLFCVDGCFMTAERDEFVYHENLVHVNANTHPEPRSALVIGGGDGGSARRLLQHPSIRRVHIVELDAAVVEMARAHLFTVHAGALDDARVRITIGDGRAYVAQASERYDLIVLDLSDPQGHAAALYEAGFYRLCADRLEDGGLMSLHVANPLLHAERCRRIFAALAEAFSVVRPYLVPITLYGGMWAMASVSNGPDAASVTADIVRRRLRERGINGLRYYNEELHGAQFVLPNGVRELLGEAR